ncbi:hypothetical protein Q5752_002190 [Cryptotrichosporon argae]
MKYDPADIAIAALPYELQQLLKCTLFLHDRVAFETDVPPCMPVPDTTNNAYRRKSEGKVEGQHEVVARARKLKDVGNEGVKTILCSCDLCNLFLSWLRIDAPPADIPTKNKFAQLWASLVISMRFVPRPLLLKALQPLVHSFASFPGLPSGSRDARSHDRQRERERSPPRDRTHAEGLVKGEVTEYRREERVEEGPGVRTRYDLDDGVPWYEATKRETKQDLSTPTPANAYFADTVGDKDVLRYAIVASTAAPRYRRDGYGRILGLPGGLRVVHSRERTDRGIEVAPLGKPYVARAILRPQSQQHVRIALASSAEGDLTADYTSFGPRHTDRDDDEPDYKRLKQSTDDDDDHADTGVLYSLGPVSTRGQDVRAKVAEMERLVRSEPANVAAWLRYAALGHAEAENGSLDLAASKTAAAEVKLALLSRALDAHTDNFLAPDLHMAYLRVAEDVWSARRVTDRWRNVLRELRIRGAKDEDVFRVWLGYIDWRQTGGFGAADVGGGVEEVVDVYVECLGQLAKWKDAEAAEEYQVYLFLRACLFLRHAGFVERATAVFQALIEITFFKPDYLRPPLTPFDRQEWFSGVLADFEGFWDAESPRIGEPGALGWRATHADPQPPPAPDARDTPAPAESTDPFARWHHTERAADAAYARPGRASNLDGPGDDDPFHVVFFDDVAPLLFPVQSPMARLQLIYAFTNYLGLPLTPPDVPTTAPAANDPHLQWAIGANDALRAAFWPPRPSKRILWQTVGGEPMQPEQPRALSSPFAGPVKSWMQERGSLLGVPGEWFRVLEAHDIAHVDEEFARNALAMLRPLVPDPSFTVAIFAFEAATSPKSAVKLAKTVLSADRDNLALWDGYARLERQRGRLAAARNVYVTALQAALARRAAAESAPGGDSGDLAIDEDEMWAAWAEMEWAHGEDACLEVVVMAAGQGRERIAACLEPEHTPARPTPIALLKARQYYGAPLLPLSASRRAVAAYFVATQDGPESARDLLLSVIDALPAGHPQQEETYQLVVRLLHVHVGRHPSPAALTRDVLAAALVAFPNNTAFLSLYLWGEAGGRVYGRMRALVDRLTREDAGVVGALWAAWAEAVGAGRNFYDGGAERVRRALDRGIYSVAGKRSVALWKLYIEFETLVGRPAAAKALVYRAIAAVGGCKDFYLLPFGPLRAHYSPRELADMAEVMLEKGVRVRVPTDTFWTDDDVRPTDEGEGGDGDGDYDGDGDGGAGDEYAVLRDIEVAKPY